METFLLFGIILIFSVLWTILTNNFLPNNLVGHTKNNSKYDDQQRTLITETLATTCMWLIYVFVLTLLFRFFGFWDVNGSLIANYPEVVFLVVTCILIISNYFAIKKKNSSKRH